MNNPENVPEVMLPSKSSEGGHDEPSLIKRNFSIMADTERLFKWLEDRELSLDRSSYIESKTHLLLVGAWGYICLSRRFYDRRELKTLREIVTYDESRARKYITMICGLSWNPEAFLPHALGEYGLMSPETFSAVYAEARELVNSLSFQEMANLSLGRSTYIGIAG